MQRVTTFLMFERGGAEAVKLYSSIFQDVRVDDCTVDPATGQLLHASFAVGGHEFVAMDGGEGFEFAEGMSLYVNCESQDEVDYYWDALLADGGEPGRCGWLKDRFGISWQVIPRQLPGLIGGPEPGRAQRAMQAMLQMGKIDLAELEAAYAGK